MERFLKTRLENGRFSDVTAQRSRIMSAIRGKSNRTTELPLKMAFVRAGVKGWVLHPPTICGKPDFYFPAQRIAVFVDGCFWHGCPKCGHIPHTRSAFWEAKIRRNRQRDTNNTRLLASAGIQSFRFWEHELRHLAQLEGHVTRIEAFLARS